MMRPHILAATANSIENFNRIFGTKLRVEDAPFVGPRMQAQKTVEMGSEYKISSGQNVVEIALINGTWVGMHHYGPDGACDDVHVRDVELLDHTKWASRSYRMRSGNKIEYTSFRNVVDEHAIYWNLCGGFIKGSNALVISHTFFENVGSQGVQLVQRTHEQGFDFSADAIPGAPVIFSDSLMRNIGSGWGGNNRASYAISAFGREIQTADGKTTLQLSSIDQDFYLRHVMVDNSMQTQALGKDGATSHGALYVGPRPRAVINGLVALMGKTDRPVGRFERVEDVVLDSCYVHAEGGQPRIEFENCGRINVRNCHGNVDLHLKTSVGSVKVGTIETGYSQPGRVAP